MRQFLRGHRLYWLASVLVLGYLFARLPELPNALDHDEVFGVRLAKLSHAEVVAEAAWDVSHPPIFYQLHKVWQDLFGTDEVLLHLLPLLLSLGCLIPFFLLCRDLRLGPEPTLLALFLWAANTFVAGYAVYMRMFILLQMLSLFSLWLCVRLVQEDPLSLQTRIAMLAVNLLMVHVHYWGWIWLATQGLFLWFANRQGAWTFACWNLLVLLGFLPWVFAVVRAVLLKGTMVAQIEWIDKPSPAEVIFLYGTFNGLPPLPRGTVLGFLFLVVPATFGLILGRNTADPKGAALPPRQVDALLACCAFVPVAATFILSHLARQSVWAERQLVICAVPYWMLIARGICAMPWPAMRRGAAAGACLWSLAAAILLPLHGPRRVDWRELADGIRAADGPHLLVSPDRFITVPMEHYLAQADPEWQVQLAGVLEKVDADRFWFAARESTWKEETPVADWLRERGLEATGAPVRFRSRTQFIEMLPVRRSPPE